MVQASQQALKDVETIPWCNYICFRTVPDVYSHGSGLKQACIKFLGPFQGVIMISDLGPSLGVCSHGPSFTTGLKRC